MLLKPDKVIIQLAKVFCQQQIEIGFKFSKIMINLTIARRYILKLLMNEGKDMHLKAFRLQQLQDVHLCNGLGASSEKSRLGMPKGANL
jgi:hypothetical protein